VGTLLVSPRPFTMACHNDMLGVNARLHVRGSTSNYAFCETPVPRFQNYLDSPPFPM
jgi:hypothetical protein